VKASKWLGLELELEVPGFLPEAVADNLSDFGRQRLR
jgi:hypothetical protein